MPLQTCSSLADCECTSSPTTQGVFIRATASNHLEGAYGWISYLSDAAATLHGYLGLLALHWVYLGHMERITIRNESLPAWTKLAKDGTKTCNVILLLFLGCVTISMLVVCYSLEAAPRTIGWLAVVINGDGILNTAVICVYMRLLKRDPSLAQEWSSRERERAAKLFAFPISSFLWWVVAAGTSTALYSRQPNAFHWLPFLNKHNVEEALPRIENDIPWFACVAVGLAIAVALCRFVFVVRSVVRLGWGKANMSEEHGGDHNLQEMRGRSHDGRSTHHDVQDTSNHRGDETLSVSLSIAGASSSSLTSTAPSASSAPEDANNGG